MPPKKSKIPNKPPFVFWGLFYVLFAIKKIVIGNFSLFVLFCLDFCTSLFLFYDFTFFKIIIFFSFLISVVLMSPTILILCIFINILCYQVIQCLTRQKFIVSWCHSKVNIHSPTIHHVQLFICLLAKLSNQPITWEDSVHLGTLLLMNIWTFTFLNKV